MVEVIHSSVLDVLRERYNNDVISDGVYKHFKNRHLIDKYFHFDLVDNKTELTRRMMPELIRVEAYLSPIVFEEKVKEWVPLLSQYTRTHIVSFMKKKSPIILFELVSKRENFVRKFKPYMEEFNKNYKSIVSYEFNKQIRTFLSRKYGNDTAAANEHFLALKSTNPNFDPEILFDEKLFADWLLNPVSRVAEHQPDQASRDGAFWIYTELNNILHTRYKYDESRFQAAMHHFRSKQIGEKLHESQKITADNVHSTLMTLIEDYEKMIALEALKQNIRESFPHFKESLINAMCDFVKTQNTGIDDISAMSTNRQDFSKSFDLKSFTKVFSNRREIEEEIDRQVKRLLMKKYKENNEAIEAVFNNYKISNSELDPKLLFDENTLAENLQSSIDYFELRNKLDNWFPYDKELNKEFVYFLMKEKLSKAAVRNLSLSKQTFLKNQFFDRYVQDNVIAFRERVYKKIQVIVNQKYRRDPVKVKTTMADLRNKRLENNFTPQMLYNSALITQLVKDEFEKLTLHTN